MIFEELTPEIRALMLSEFQAEQQSQTCAPYRPKVLTALGESVFCSIMQQHLVQSPGLNPPPFRRCASAPC